MIIKPNEIFHFIEMLYLFLNINIKLNIKLFLIKIT
jgi:hypothetical protein